jgi:FtsH-binding integral membrane protein
MSYADDSNPYRNFGMVAADAAVDERVDFIRKTYLHLGAAVGAFAAIEAVLLNIPGVGQLSMRMFSGYNFLIVIGLFMVVSWLARSWAESSASVPIQYAGLGLYVVAQAVIFVPLLYIAGAYFPGDNIIATAGLITVIMFSGLTAIVFTTKADFSFLRTALMLGGLGAMGFIICSMIFGFSLGLVFTVAMLILCCGYILYDTSNVLHHYRVGQHVAASLALFASVAMLFWYVIRLLMILNRR